MYCQSFLGDKETVSCSIYVFCFFFVYLCFFGKSCSTHLCVICMEGVIGIIFASFLLTCFLKIKKYKIDFLINDFEWFWCVDIKKFILIYFYIKNYFKKHTTLLSQIPKSFQDECIRFCTVKDKGLPTGHMSISCKVVKITS